MSVWDGDDGDYIFIELGFFFLSCLPPLPFHLWVLTLLFYLISEEGGGV